MAKVTEPALRHQCNSFKQRDHGSLCSCAGEKTDVDLPEIETEDDLVLTKTIIYSDIIVYFDGMYTDWFPS
ncbi:hypothetical protein DUI87_16368 [Hirundo rustica rustica]|uniref:Uncharacterized protein n=1 Tax=Hirundo rustica rustica TaxID=333673 RepID=A0A3M0KIA7_HIRRU|nr:hypothetical protein DUI87_16368 [Hirundo rustica rustica]